ncbi:MAG: ribosome maturation factor RimM [Gammaproteobacteria bacterium]|jgi:16S rRNA processing protein RimM
MSPNPQPDQRLITLGRLTGIYGLRGWLKVFSETEPREGIVNYPLWWVRQHGGWKRFRVEQGRRHGKTVVVKLEGIDDRDEAARLLNADIAVEREQLPETATDEYYWTDLEGLSVVCQDGTELGRIDHLLETGANDVLVVQGDRERLIPYIPGQVIREVDLENGRMVVDWDPEF